MRSAAAEPVFKRRRYRVITPPREAQAHALENAVFQVRYPSSTPA